MISMIESFNDHQLPFKTRIAIADLLFYNFRIQLFIAAFKGILKEFKSIENPSFVFIETIMRLLNAKFALLTAEEVAVMKANYNLNEMYVILHSIASHSSDSFIDLFTDTKMLFKSMFEMKWNKIQFPDGIIKATNMKYSDDEIADGLFSDDDQK